MPTTPEKLTKYEKVSFEGNTNDVCYVYCTLTYISNGLDTGRYFYIVVLIYGL